MSISARTTSAVSAFVREAGPVHLVAFVFFTAAFVLLARDDMSPPTLLMSGLTSAVSGWIIVGNVRRGRRQRARRQEW